MVELEFESSLLTNELNIPLAVELVEFFVRILFLIFHVFVNLYHLYLYLFHLKIDATV